MQFDERVINLVKKVPRGKVTTYKMIAEKLGTRAYRAAGNALRNNKNQKTKRRFERIYWRKFFCNFKKETIVMATKQQKYEALKTAIEMGADTLISHSQFSF